ncbi:hypothetical protein MN0502_16690 [Arthrobacter sp. MN05-02]|nr:hypothetical protein MN0502_16690 [Arthrobacter sp. MN05-02]
MSDTATSDGPDADGIFQAVRSSVRTPISTGVRFDLGRDDDGAPVFFRDTRTLQTSLLAGTGKSFALSCRLHHARAARSPRSTGDEARPVFVLVHGIGMSHRYFARLEAELLPHGDVVVLDLPGFGGTPRPPGQLGVADYATVVADSLEQADITSCIVIGHSMGAQFVTELALRRPDLVRAVVLIGPVTDTDRPSALRNARALAVDTLLERPVTNLLVGAAYLQCGIRWYRTELPVMLGYRLDDRLADVPQPVLVLRGSLDPIAGRRWCRHLARVARDGRLVEVPGQPHAVHRAGAVIVADAILGFAERLPAPSAGTRDTAQQQDRGIAQPASSVQPSAPASTPSSTPNWHGITVGDRQCRAHLIEHQPGHLGANEDPAGAGAPSPHPVPVFVLIHGIGMSHRYFLRLGRQLSRAGSVLLIDLPGYGWTRRPAREATNPANAELLADLLDGMGISSCVVVGHSMGVQTATELAIQRPDLVSHVVLIGAAVDALRRTVPQQALTLGLNSVLEKPVLNTLQFLDVLRCGPRWYLSELSVAMDYRLEERLPRATQPVLVLRGSRDLVAGTRWSRSLADSSRNGVLAVVAGAPHAVHHSSPGIVAAHIMSFLAGAVPAGAGIRGKGRVLVP